MAIPVYGLQAIKDKAIRDAIYQIAQRAGTGDGTGGAQVEVQANDPTNASNPGASEGDIVYATGTDSIWIFTDTTWERASSGLSGIVVLIEARIATEGQTPNWATFGNTVQTSPNFKNDTARTIGLVPKVFEGGTEWSSDDYDAVTTWEWRKNGLTFTPQATQVANITGTDQRVLLIDQDDVAEGNVNEVFNISITY